MISKILLDKNIVLDIISGRSRKAKVLEILSNFEEFCISTHTFTTCFYILRKDYSKEDIYDYLSKFEIIEIDKTDCHLAYNLAKNVDDIEDCIELFTAKRNHSKTITADKEMVLKYGDYFNIIEV